MKTGKITLFKKTEINNEVRYFVVDETGWCMGNSTDYDEADKIYNLCVGNRAKGLPTEEILKQSTALIGEHYTANEEVDKMVSERLREEKPTISPYNLAHSELSTDCCGIFNRLRDDGIVVCNECGMSLHDAVKTVNYSLYILRDELIKYEIYHKNDEISAVGWIDEYLKTRDSHE